MRVSRHPWRALINVKFDSVGGDCFLQSTHTCLLSSSGSDTESLSSSTVILIFPPHGKTGSSRVSCAAVPAKPRGRLICDLPSHAPRPIGIFDDGGGAS
jgi:hypothetical protein